MCVLACGILLAVMEVIMLEIEGGYPFIWASHDPATTNSVGCYDPCSSVPERYGYLTGIPNE